MNIICFGDSLTSCGGENGRFSDILQDRFPTHRFINRGQGGDTLVDALERFDRDVLNARPDIVLVALGANDWWRATRPPAQWVQDLENILRRLRAAGIQPVVLGVFGPYRDEQGRMRVKTYGFDQRAEVFSRMEAGLAARYNAPHVANMQAEIIGRRCGWSDRNHPNEYGNRHVADAIEPLLETLLRTPARPLRKPRLRTLRDLWREAVTLRPERLAAVDGTRRLTYAAADEQIRRLAAGLVRHTGVARPKVAVHLPNCLEYFLLYWAVARLGGVIVPLNTMLKADNLAGIFARTQPDLLVMRSPSDPAILRALESAPVPVTVHLDRSDETSSRPWASLFADASEPPERGNFDDAAIVMHTSGTTSHPKGAVMRHGDLLFNVMNAINAHQFNPSDVHLLVNPMFHCTALYSTLPTAAYTKTPVVITAANDAESLLELIARERITTFLSVPAIFQRLLAHPAPQRYDVSSLRLMAYAGSMMPLHAIQGLQRQFPGVELHNFFGLTETICMTHVLSGAEAEERPDSIGRLLPFVTACIVDPDTLEERAPGEVGELLFAREVVISTYYKQPGKLETALVKLDGRTWFRTGDLAMVDEEGYFFLRGRRKDMIIVGGENVYAAEVEGVLTSHPGVVEAAVKGVPARGARQSLGESVEAWVVANDRQPTERELRRYCFERLASYKVPVRIHFLPQLPRNPAGKVLKNDLV